MSDNYDYLWAMLELKITACEDCNTFVFKDVTGLYDATDNLTGYGVFNGVATAAAFETYVLNVWFPNSDITGDPDYTYDLLANLPIPDSNGFYEWVFTADMLDVETLRSGLYTMTVSAYKDPLTYTAETENIFTCDISDVVEAKVADADPACGCAPGCEDPFELYPMLLTVKCGGVCDANKAQAIIDSLYEKSSNCC